MLHLIFLSALLPLGALAAVMTTDMSEVFMSQALASWDGSDWDRNSHSPMENAKHVFVRPDSIEMQPQDFICSTYSLLGKINHSYRSNPPILYNLLDLPLTLDAEEWERARQIEDQLQLKAGDMYKKFNEDPSSCDKECIKTLNAWNSVALALLSTRFERSMIKSSFVPTTPSRMC